MEAEPLSFESSVIPGAVSLYGASVECGLHCLVWLVGSQDGLISSRELADLQGVSATMMAKVMARLQKAGIVTSSGGISGGYRLGRPPEAISVLDVVMAIEGGRRLFECKDIRRNCILFDGSPPEWARRGTCGIHAVMLRAEKAMYQELGRTSLLDLAHGVPAPDGFAQHVAAWFDGRAISRETTRRAAVVASNRRRSDPSA